MDLADPRTTESLHLSTRGIYRRGADASPSPHSRGVRMSSSCTCGAPGRALANRLTRRALLVILLVVASGQALALDPSLKPSQYILDHWQITDGLPENYTVPIARTPDGYLWLGTVEGLARFDGVRFVVFDRNNEAALPSNWILALHVDRAGKLWIGTQDGLVVFENGRFKPYNAVAGLSHVSILAILEDKAGRLWIGTEHGLVEIDHDRGHVFGIADGLSDASIRALLEDRKGIIWVATASGGLHRFDGTTFESVAFGAGQTVDPISSMYADQDGTVWLGTENRAIYRQAGDRFDAVARAGQLGSAVPGAPRG